jgi:4-amino-4-deoxy-L-arabinose transferase-like glycosyltransferase
MYFLILSIILFASTAIRIYNLNYNSPFSDEAIYVVIGRMGLFQFDWGSYNASAWVAGSVYIYPVMSALSYMLFGIVGSRFLNVIFGVLTVEAVFALTVSLSPLEDKTKYLSGLIAGAIVGGASVSLYLSRLATYDMPSFFFLLLSLCLLVQAQKTNEKIGKWYFFSSIFLLLSFATKIINGIYLPFILLYSFLESKRINDTQKAFWRKYLLYPLFAGIILYVITSLGNNILYLKGQASLPKADLSQLLNVFLQNTNYLLVFWVIGTVGMFLKKQWKLWFYLTLGGLLLPITHLLTHRQTTFDKHIFLTVALFSIVGGLGTSNLIALFNHKLIKSFSAAAVTTVLIIFWALSFNESQRFNSQWENTTPVLTYLSEEVHPNDKLLSEVGPPAILATYDKNYPINTTTFDWFEYRNTTGDESYAQAVKDGYFDVIEIEDENKYKNPTYLRVHNIVANSLTDGYRLIYSQDGYQIFRRVY